MNTHSEQILLNKTKIKEIEYHILSHKGAIDSLQIVIKQMGVDLECLRRSADANEKLHTKVLQQIIKASKVEE